MKWRSEERGDLPKPKGKETEQNKRRARGGGVIQILVRTSGIMPGGQQVLIRRLAGRCGSGEAGVAVKCYDACRSSCDGSDHLVGPRGGRERWVERGFDVAERMECIEPLRTRTYSCGDALMFLQTEKMLLDAMLQSGIHDD